MLANPPVLWDIESDPVLAGTKLIAEAWDAAGLYQVGSFVGDSWKEWNGRFRDDVRGFFRGEAGLAGRFADRIVGSPELYGHKEREPEQSVNFVTCHDGFTLNDLVSYDRKHNEANGEDNRDGSNDNRSWNCGVEGPTDDPAIEQLRNRQVKNFLTVTLLSLGVPMILMGDEVRRTQRGNNNAYCQDNERAWFDWTLLEQHADVHRFVRLLNARRLLRDVEHEEQRVSLTQHDPGGEQGLARREARPARLGPVVAQPGADAGADARGPAGSLDLQRVLGAARVRVAAGRLRPLGALAPLDRHRAGLPARHRARGRRRRGCPRASTGPRPAPWSCSSPTLPEPSAPLG